MIHVRQASDRSNVVLEFSGSLDVRSAEELALVALQQPISAHLIIDISQASSVHDSALGHLIDALPRGRPRTLRGAGRHQTRLLRYLGEAMEEDEAPHTD